MGAIKKKMIESAIRQSCGAQNVVIGWEAQNDDNRLKGEKRDSLIVSVKPPLSVAYVLKKTLEAAMRISGNSITEHIIGGERFKPFARASRRAKSAPSHT